MASLPSTGELTWKIGGAMGKARSADVALLRYAYLLLFRMFVYGAIVTSAMTRIRAQICAPEEHILPHRWILPEMQCPMRRLELTLSLRQWKPSHF
jgi:hypothetical protein